MVLRVRDGAGGPDVSVAWPTYFWQLARVEPERGADGITSVELCGELWVTGGRPTGEFQLRYSSETGYTGRFLELIVPDWAHGPEASDPQEIEDVEAYWERQQNHPADRFALPAGLTGLFLTGASTGGANGREGRLALAQAVGEGRIDAATVDVHLPAILRSAHPNAPSRLASVVADVGVLGAPWPVLTRSVELAAESEGARRAGLDPCFPSPSLSTWFCDEPKTSGYDAPDGVRTGE